jgi:hypothetical protein
LNGAYCSVQSRLIFRHLKRRQVRLLLFSNFGCEGNTTLFIISLAATTDTQSQEGEYRSINGIHNTLRVLCKSKTREALSDYYVQETKAEFNISNIKQGGVKTSKIPKGMNDLVHV